MNEFSFVDNIPFSIAAGDSLSLPAGSWDYLYMAKLSGGDLLAEGSALRLPFILGRQIRVSKKETGTILLTNRGSTTAEGVIYAGSGDVQDSAVVGEVAITGTVSVSQLPPTSVDMYTAYMGVQVTAAQYLYAAIENPLGSGKTLSLRTIGGSADSASVVRVGRMAGHGVHAAYGGPVSAYSLVGGGSSVAVLKRGSSTGGSNFVQSEEIYTESVGANERFILPLSSDLQLAEGEILTFRYDQVGSFLAYPILEWEEF